MARSREGLPAALNTHDGASKLNGHPTTGQTEPTVQAVPLADVPREALPAAGPINSFAEDAGHGGKAAASKAQTKDVHMPQTGSLLKGKENKAAANNSHTGVARQRDCVI